MRQTRDFDAFYRDARDRLLVQTFALTGDLVASRRAVRDAFVVAWHRWGKLSLLDDPEAVVRPHAWQLAQRRHTARILHREKHLDEGVRATLEALGKLTVDQRRALLLTQLAAVSMTEMARELGLGVEGAERELQAGASRFSLERDVPASAIRPLLEPVAASAVGHLRWPRASIVRRAGNARRRTHTTLGVVAAVVALVGSGVAVSDGAGARPTLARGSQSDAPDASLAAQPAVELLPASSMLDATQLDQSMRTRTWSVGRTGDNSGGNGLVVPCQGARYADPDGRAALVRTFDSSRPKGQKPRTATQITELSGSTRAAIATFRTTVAWFAGCTDGRVQLLSTRTPERVADEAVLLVLRRFDDPLSTFTVGVARTGDFVTTAFVDERGGGPPDRGGTADMLSSAVGTLCVLPGAGLCGAPEPELNDRPPIPVGEDPALLSEVDLPPVGDVEQPWVGTEPVRATDNVAATRCDQASFKGRFQGARFSENVTRSYLVPEADLPAEFGITETVGALRRRQAAAFVENVRDKVSGCPDKDLGTDVELLRRSDDDDLSMSAWRLTVEVTDKRTISYLMAIVRSGTAVGQLTFVPGGGAEMSDQTFLDVAERAQERLDELPRPS